MKKILIIEDDKFICKAYKNGLTDAGYEVDYAEDGKEGMEKISSFKPDVILLDLMMPVKNDTELMQNSRK